MEKTLWELALGRFARVVLAEMKGKRVVSTFPISLHIINEVIKITLIAELETNTQHRI